MSFANAKAEIIHDKRHKPLFLNPGEKAFLRLHKGYNLPGPSNKKLSQQRCGPFTIKRRVGRLTYELDLPARWKIHPVISVTPLEPASDDSVKRVRPSHPDSVFVEGDMETEKSYEVEKILAKRTRQYGHSKVNQYLGRWLGYDPEFDE